MMHQDSLEPAAIRCTLERLQESARRSEYFVPAFYIHRNPRKWLINILIGYRIISADQVDDRAM